MARRTSQGHGWGRLSHVALHSRICRVRRFGAVQPRLATAKSRSRKGGPSSTLPGPKTPAQLIRATRSLTGQSALAHASYYGERACQGAHPCQTVRKRRAELPHSGGGMWPGFPPPLTYKSIALRAFVVLLRRGHVM